MIRTAITKNGKVKGLPADDPRVTVFRGIPFAAPPVGDNRWRAPKPCEDWDGVRNCYEFGPVSMQDQPGVGDDIYCREWHVDPDIPVSEDCLYLNVWTGAKSTDEKLPVLVWIYGGAFQWGYTAEMEFNGERLARHGVIVVSIAYRLGVFGFLAHPFGGDPNNITLAGQSAGGASVTFALANPDAAKLIKKTSVFSGFIRNPFYSDDIIQPKPLRTAEANGEEFISFIGCNSVDEARNMDSTAIRDAYAEYAKTHPRFVPCIDGVYVTEDPYRMILEGKTPDLPMFAGYTKDEFLDRLPVSADH